MGRAHGDGVASLRDPFLQMAMGDRVFRIAATAASGRAELALLSSGHRRLTKRDPLRGSEVSKGWPEGEERMPGHMPRFCLMIISLLTNYLPI